MKNIEIRKAILDDYAELCKIYTELDEYHRVNHPELFVKPVGFARGKRYIADKIADNNQAIFVAELDNKIVGLAECYILKSPGFPIIRRRKWVHLDNIAVLRDYQECHIGSYLLEKVIQWAEFKGIKRVELKVYSFNKNAIGFYSSKGFRELSKMMYLDL